MARSDLATPVDVDTAEIRTLGVPPSASIPNNPVWPIIIAPKALGGANEPRSVEALMTANGWRGTWTWQVFDYHHYHPDAFEVLAVASGAARLMLGGPQGQVVTVTAGDVVVLPPGTGHKQIDKTDDFRICGGYPPGQEDYSTLRDSDEYDASVLARIAAVALPGTDPVWGKGGPLLNILVRRGDG